MRAWGVTVRNPNSCLSCLCTGTLTTVSIKGNLKCRPGGLGGGVVSAQTPDDTHLFRLNLVNAVQDHHHPEKDGYGDEDDSGRKVGQLNV